MLAAPALDGASLVLQALGQFPVSVGPVRRLEHDPVARVHLGMSVVDALALKPRVQQVGPGDPDRDNEQFGAERQTALC